MYCILLNEKLRLKHAWLECHSCGNMSDFYFFLCIFHVLLYVYHQCFVKKKKITIKVHFWFRENTHLHVGPEKMWGEAGRDIA